MFVRRRGPPRPLEGHALDPCQPGADQVVGAVLDHRVAPVSAGPPLGGLYLKPPSSGGLCDGVMTTPSARPAARPRLWPGSRGR